MLRSEIVGDDRVAHMVDGYQVTLELKLIRHHYALDCVAAYQQGLFVLVHLIHCQLAYHLYHSFFFDIVRRRILSSRFRKVFAYLFFVFRVVRIVL